MLERHLRESIFTAAVIVAGGSLGTEAQAAFAGLLVEDKSPVGAVQGHTYFVTNVWAGFTNPGDRLVGPTQAVLSVHVGATFFQSPLGEDTAPDSSLLPANPTLAFDTFVTIGLKSVPIGGGDSTALESGSGFTTTTFLGGWFDSDPDSDQGVPGAHGAPSGAIPGQVYVLIAQLTIQDPTAGQFAAGDMLIAWKAAGSTTISFGRDHFESFFVPGPAALALFALAGRGIRSKRRRVTE